jgi:hypothetical protein
MLLASLLNKLHPDKFTLSQPNCLVRGVIAQILLKSNFPSDFGHTGPLMTNFLLDQQPMNPWPAPPDNGAPEERLKLKGHTPS